LATLIAWAVVAGLCCLAVGLVLQPLWRRRHLARVAVRSAGEHIEAALPKAVACWPALTGAQRQRLIHQLRVFLHEKQFHGCNGLDISDDMRCTIAANACLLRLQADADCFPAVRHILVYPGAFWVQHDQPDADGLVSDEPALLSGEAWDAGRVILSWEDCEAAARGDGGNVIVHEFAHQLDYEATQADGAPPLADYETWARVFGDIFEQLRETGSPVLDLYGASEPAECFAVATESFFQQGDALQAHHPALFDLLSTYFAVDTRQSG